MHLFSEGMASDVLLHQTRAGRLIGLHDIHHDFTTELRNLGVAGSPVIHCTYGISDHPNRQ